eukprot:Colp12_sorted_trinity150504_noHs@2682
MPTARQPWQAGFNVIKKNGQWFKNRKPYQLIEDWKIRKGDEVQVVNGPIGSGDIGKVGRVLQVLKWENKLVVENVNLKKSRRDRPEGVPFTLKECPIHYSNVAILDPVDKKPTRVMFQRDDETGKRLRISERSGEVIPEPKKVPSPLDIKKSLYVETSKCTLVPELKESTFAPTLETFEQTMARLRGLKLGNRHNDPPFMPFGPHMGEKPEVDEATKLVNEALRSRTPRSPRSSTRSPRSSRKKKATA